ncbi:hypothetical protein [Carboxylicivirga sp. M1479]|uniref:hypothetical protein n=1 Tax=Carboxylicivirga sp. M1479 TaxID=2594476 RepID=UPI001178247F|nr:hypothetical protein [Carboxylicivirga sp. M1479]TRX65784.1 hypothetical protein FNN09_16920 [Carboxylicivirga sp. M1479]
MRTILTFLSALLFVSSVSGKEHLPSKEDYQAFLNTKTLVVMDVNPMSDFNFKIKEVMESVWTLTDFEFISNAEFEDKRNDPSYSFLITTVATFDADKTKARYNFLSLLMGETDTDVRNLPDLCSLPLSYLRVEDTSYAYKVEAFVRFIQDHVSLMNERPELIKANAFKYYNKNVTSLSDKTLLVVKEDLSPEVNTIGKLKSIYPYNIKIVTQDEVEDAIERKDENTVFMHKVGPEGTKYKARCYKMLIGADSSTFYYFDYHMVSKKNRDGLLEKDLKKMAS